MGMAVFLNVQTYTESMVYLGNDYQHNDNRRVAFMGWYGTVSKCKDKHV